MVVCVVVTTWVVVIVVSVAKYVGSSPVRPYGGGGGVIGRAVSVDRDAREGEPLVPMWNRPTIA